MLPRICGCIRAPQYTAVSHLDEADSACDLESLSVRVEAAVSLLLAVGADEGVNRDDLGVVESLDCLLDLELVSVRVHDEGQGVVLLNQLHGSVREDGFLDDSVVVGGGGLVGVEGASVLGLGGTAARVGSPELDLGVDLALGEAHGSLDCVSNLLGLVSGLDS